AGLTVVQDGSLPDAVVVGADERLSFLDVVRGAVLVQRGARFIATNNDPSYPLPIGTVPATGAVVCAIRLATGRRPLVVGKPEPLMFRLARETLPAGATALVIGDRMESDILGAHRAGFPAILVASSAFAMPRPGDPRRPDAVVRSLADLFERPPDLPVRVPSTDQWPERVVAGVVLLLVDETRGTLALLPSDGGWQLPWTSLEPLETLEGAAWRLVHHLLQGSAAHLEWVGAVSDTEAVLLRGADGELVHVVGSCFRAAVHQSADTDRVRWHALDSLVEVLPGERVTWIMRRLAPHQ
ncbi:MAG: HAD-IA family hydrolase, partial [Thermomicrobium sp.]|nr:HAD-IA family hydrolase [Thermomicrobium sp.]